MAFLAGLAPAVLAGEPGGNVQHFEASPFAGDVLMLRTASAPPEGPGGGLFVNNATGQWTVTDRTYGDPWTREIVQHQLMADLFGSFFFKEGWGVAVDLPLVLSTGGRGGTQRLPAADGWGLGDIRVAGRYLALPRVRSGYGAALDLEVGFPTSTGTTYAGSGTVWLAPTIVADARFDETLLAANLGYRLQESQTVGDDRLGGGLRLGLGVVQGISNDAARLFGEVYLLSAQEDFFEKQGTNLEGQLGASMAVGRWVRVFAAGGGGFLSGIGEPSMRLTGGVRLEPQSEVEAPPPPPDRDGDGIPDQDDGCPAVRGPRSKEPGRNGCPPDKDRDGVPDLVDACPEVAGAASKDLARNGCPSDRDGDKIPDGADGCPDEPGVPSEDPRRYGCPSDKDNDGIYDKDDACPDELGPASADPKKHGCPPDKDGDGVPDAQDACPDLAGEAGKDAARNGCPAPKVTKEKIEIAQRIEFTQARAELLPESLPILDAIAKVILEHPEITKMVVEGHTDDQGGAEYNLELSEKRAQAVKEYLVKAGVARERIEAKGYGHSKPIAPNDTEEGRKTNRRVEFRVINAETPR